MLLLLYPPCTTCQRAKKWLDERNTPYTERHIIEDPPTYEELKNWYEKSGLELKRFFNTNGLVYKNLHLKEKLPAMTQEEKLRLLATDGMLVKRPIVVTEDGVLVGFKIPEWEKLL